MIIGFLEEKTVKKGKTRTRGGQTLRDTLYAATEKKVRKQATELPTQLTTPSLLLTSTPKSQKAIKRKRLLNEDRQQGTNIEIDVTISNRPRRAIRTKQLTDFVYDFDK